MPRNARQVSKTHIYHVMLRGNERKNIFLEVEDKVRLIETLYHKKQNNAFCLYAYCIMDNHVHFVIKEQKDSISRIMKRLGTSYAHYYNKKYKRVGHVFQDRYKSETIEDESYLLSVIRYIHNNPEKAGICRKQEYRWSSYQLYTQVAKEYRELLECDEVLSIFSEDKHRAMILFREFGNKEDQDDFIDMQEKEGKLGEEEALECIKHYLEKKSIGFEHLNQREYRLERETVVNELIYKSSLSLRKIAEVTGINRETVRKISVSKEPSQ